MFNDINCVIKVGITPYITKNKSDISPLELMEAIQESSLGLGGLPIGLAHRMALCRPVTRGQIVTWEDVVIDQQDSAIAFRREMEWVFQTLN